MPTSQALLFGIVMMAVGYHSHSAASLCCRAQNAVSSYSTRRLKLSSGCAAR